MQVFAASKEAAKSIVFYLNTVHRVYCIMAGYLHVLQQLVEVAVVDEQCASSKNHCAMLLVKAVNAFNRRRFNFVIYWLKGDLRLVQE